jgi:steroid delta-isomerase
VPLVWTGDFARRRVAEDGRFGARETSVVSEQQMKQAMQAYIDTYNRDDLEALLGLYADDATVEDPVGKPLMAGKVKIREFYTMTMKTGARLSLAAPIRASHGDSAAMAFDVTLTLPPHGRLVIRVIDVMSFDAQGKFKSMRAYWGPSDMEKIAEPAARRA